LRVVRGEQTEERKKSAFRSSSFSPPSSSFIRTSIHDTNTRFMRRRRCDRIATRMSTSPTRGRGSDAAPAAKVSCWRFVQVDSFPSSFSPSLSLFLFLPVPPFFSSMAAALAFPSAQSSCESFRYPPLRGPFLALHSIFYYSPIVEVRGGRARAHAKRARAREREGGRERAMRQQVDGERIGACRHCCSPVPTATTPGQFRSLLSFQLPSRCHSQCATWRLLCKEGSHESVDVSKEGVLSSFVAALKRRKRSSPGSSVFSMTTTTSSSFPHLVVSRPRLFPPQPRPHRIEQSQSTASSCS